MSDKLPIVAKAKANSESWQKVIYDEALKLARRGIYVVPLRRLSKKLLPKKFNIGYHSAAKNEATINRWFRPGSGKFRGYNIGIACGKQGGVFVLDVDKHGDVNGREELKKLEEAYGELPESPMQQTPNGGLHYLYAWEPGAVSSISKVAPGIDTRGGTEDAFKSHIVVAPSVIVDDEGNTGQYRWIVEPSMPEYLPTAPAWICDSLGKQVMSGDRGNELVSDSDLEEAVTLGQISLMLDAIDPDALLYDEWLKIGQSINSQHCGEDGLAVWDEWSKKGERYQTKECINRWGGFSPFGSIRIGTLFYMARKAGWIPVKQDQFETVATEILSELNEKYSLVKVGNKVRVVGRNFEGSVDVMSHHEVKLLYKNRPVERSIAGRSFSANPIDIWLQWPHRRTHDGLGMFPPPLVCLDNYLNLWRGFAVEPKEGDVGTFTGFVFDVICRGDCEKFEWLLDWIAHIFQFPGEKPGTAVVIYGAEGTGKNTLTKALSKLIYQANFTHMINPKHFMSNFNSYLLNSLVCVLNEAVWSGNHQEANLLKGLVTEDFISVEMKGIDSFNARNCARIIIMTNNTWAVPAGHQSRRYFVAEISDRRKNDIAYWKICMVGSKITRESFYISS